MKVSSLQFTRRFALEHRGGLKYEHEEISLEVLPDEGDTAETLLQRTRELIEQQRPGVTGVPLTNGKPAAPPLVPKSEPPKADDKPPASSNGTNGKTKKRGRGRPPKALADARKAVEYAKESTTLEDFADRFGDARDLAGNFTLEEWEGANRELAGVYRALNSTQADPEIVSEIIKAFQAERTALEEKRKAAE